jgi:hypothetical protein
MEKSGNRTTSSCYVRRSSTIMQSSLLFDDVATCSYRNRLPEEATKIIFANHCNIKMTWYMFARRMATKCSSPLRRTHGKRTTDISSHISRHFHINSMSSMAQNPSFSSEEMRKKRKECGQKQGIYRSFHRSVQREIAPFLPEVVIAAGIIGGWVVYRTSKGKPLTPDDALERQKAYKKQEEILRRRQPEWLRNRKMKE